MAAAQGAGIGCGFVSLDELRERLGGVELRDWGSAVVVDFTRRRVEVDGEAHLLTIDELTVLDRLARASGDPVPNAELAQALSGGVSGQRRRVTAIVSRLRRKFSPWQGLIGTHPAGYSLAPSPDLTVRTFRAW